MSRRIGCARGQTVAQKRKKEKEKRFFCVLILIEWWRRSLLSGQQVEHLPEGQAHLLGARRGWNGDALWWTPWVQSTRYALLINIAVNAWLLPETKASFHVFTRLTEWSLPFHIQCVSLDPISKSNICIFFFLREQNLAEQYISIFFKVKSARNFYGNLFLKSTMSCSSSFRPQVSHCAEEKKKKKKQMSTFMKGVFNSKYLPSTITSDPRKRKAPACVCTAAPVKSVPHSYP